jgi:Arc/MetJ-type ribon-helix-helix transcriptional regulator
MPDETIKPPKRVVEVEFNEQQEVILKRLKEDGRYGATDSEIIRTVYREFLKRTKISAERES